MPLIFVQRYVVEEAILAGGTQFVDGVLSFSGPMTIYLSDAVFGQTGDYVLFDYSGGSFPNPAQLSNITVDDTDLRLSQFYSLEDDTANYRILLKLRSRGSNGTQFVDGVLDISSPMSVYLSATLYATAGTYTLFDWSGGGSFTGSASNISLYPLKAGRQVVSGPTVVGSTIQFTLA